MDQGKKEKKREMLTGISIKLLLGGGWFMCNLWLKMIYGQILGERTINKMNGK